MSFFGDYAGEFFGNFAGAFIERRARTKSRTFGATKGDRDITAYKAVNEGLSKMCLPIEDHVNKRGLKQVCSALKKSDHFAAHLAIDSNPGLRKRDVCIYLLKATVTYLCTKDPADIVRAATYTMIACR
jgi:hypothetical protein